jgi:hypothetical protein
MDGPLNQLAEKNGSMYLFIRYLNLLGDAFDNIFLKAVRVVTLHIGKIYNVANGLQVIRQVRTDDLDLLGTLGFKFAEVFKSTLADVEVDQAVGPLSK